MEAITYENLVLAVGEVAACVIDLQIVEEPGEHGKMSVIAVADKDTKEAILHDEDGVTALFYYQGEETKCLFQGLILETQVEAEGETYYIRIDAVTSSYLMDIQSYNISYQDVEITSHEFIRKVMEFMKGSKALLSIPDEKRGQIAVQYQETFWEFLKRIASEYEAYVYPDSSTLVVQLRFGLPETEETVRWDDLSYTVERDTAPKDRSGSRGNHMTFRVRTYDIVSLGTGVSFKGHRVYTGKVIRYMDRGLLVNEYVLYYEEGFRNRKYSNPLLSGVSIYGYVKDVKRNRVQVKMLTDGFKEWTSPYYFPFSTVAASSDGSGWYCMPKAGDLVRIFFPGSEEKEGYAIACAMGEPAPSQESPIVNPNLKDITAPDGKTVKFIENGILLAVAGGRGAVKLTNDGTAEVVSEEEDIYISAVEKAEVFTEEGELELSAGEQIELCSDGGSSLSLKGDTVEAAACTIWNN